MVTFGPQINRWLEENDSFGSTTDRSLNDARETIVQELRMAIVGLVLGRKNADWLAGDLLTRQQPETKTCAL